MKRVLFALAVAASMATGTFAQASLERLRRQFKEPGKEYTQAPFWFWNANITEQGLLEQIEWMTQKGVHGFVIHPRMGLSREVGYLTPRYLSLVRFAVEEAARRGMRVYLYDEAMYPSGSAHGKVVAANPAFASQGLRMRSFEWRGPGRSSVKLDLEKSESFVSAVLLRKQGGAHEPGGQLLRLSGGQLEADVPAGEHTLFVFSQIPSGGVIRGVHDDEEDNLPGAPPSADLLNPEATASFIQFTHDVYRRELSQHFGKTVRGIFTDEPTILGRRSRRGLRPWTTGFLEQLNRLAGYDFEPWLPFLWVEATGKLEETIRADFERSIEAAMNQSYYRPLYEWCTRAGIALTGHPEGGGDMGPQVYFHEPGQDVVWRWVLPGKTALEGEQSLAGKSASSMGLHLNRPVVINECFGAFGWELTMREMKWLSDWLFVRGANLIMPHAFYYSVEGPRRFERPPDVGLNNLWKDHYGAFSAYTDRLSWLMREGRPVADVAILSAAKQVPWRAARSLFENQIDFYYLDESVMAQAVVRRGRLELGQASYRVVLLDGLHAISTGLFERMLQWMKAGVQVVAYRTQLDPHPLRPGLDRARQLISEVSRHPKFLAVEDLSALLTFLRRTAGADLQADPAAPDLRFTHRVKDNIHFYLLTNEGEATLRTSVQFRQSVMPEFWDAETGGTTEVPVSFERGWVKAGIELPPMNSIIAVFDPSRRALRTQRGAPPAIAPTTIRLPDDGWRLSVPMKTIESARWGDWRELDKELETFSGTGAYEREIELPAEILKSGKRIWLDCGEVREWVNITVNGQDAGTRLWPPYRVEVTKWLQPGRNRVRLQVTNTYSNQLTKKQLPSGLFGPVEWRVSP